VQTNGRTFFFPGERGAFFAINRDEMRESTGIVPRRIQPARGVFIPSGVELRS
jgi:hypothetical protein